MSDVFCRSAANSFCLSLRQANHFGQNELHRGGVALKSVTQQVESEFFGLGFYLLEFRDVGVKARGHDVENLAFGLLHDVFRRAFIWIDVLFLPALDDAGGFLRIPPEEMPAQLLFGDIERSEEHTSELQSPCNLV